MGKKKIVLDTNVIISAFAWKGNPKLIFEKITNQEFTLLLSEKQLDEVTRVLHYPKFGFTEIQRTNFLSILKEAANLVETSGKLKIITQDPDDNIILETAIEHKADYLITGDKHLLYVHVIGHLEILTPADFLKQDL